MFAGEISNSFRQGSKRFRSTGGRASESAPGVRRFVRPNWQFRETESGARSRPPATPRSHLRQTPPSVDDQRACLAQVAAPPSARTARTSESRLSLMTCSGAKGSPGRPRRFWVMKKGTGPYTAYMDLSPFVPLLPLKVQFPIAGHVPRAPNIAQPFQERRDLIQPLPAVQ